MLEIKEGESLIDYTASRHENGREKSSRNAATHKFPLLPNEKQEDFDALAQSLAEKYKGVASPGLASLLETLVQATWLRNRADLKMAEVELAIHQYEQEEKFEEAEKLFNRLSLLQRSKTNYENSYQRAVSDIEGFRKARVAEYVAKVRIAKAVQSIASDIRNTVEPLLKSGRWTEEELLSEMEKAYQASIRDTPK